MDDKKASLYSTDIALMQKDLSVLYGKMNELYGEAFKYGCKTENKKGTEYKR